MPYEVGVCLEKFKKPQGQPLYSKQSEEGETGRKKKKKRSDFDFCST